MFDLLGRVVHRGWFLFLAAWAVTFVSGWLLAPQWIHVAQDWESGFLPPDSPSVVASDVYRKAFPQQPLGSNIVVVLVDEEPNRLDRDRAFVQDVLEPRLRQIAEAEGGIGDQPRPSDEPLFSDETKTSVPKRSAPVVARIRTPNAPGAGALLTSADQRALLVMVELTTEFRAKRNWRIIIQIEELVRQLREQGKIPPGLSLAVTGSAVISREHSLAEREGARNTTNLTVVLVIALLVLIYRAPLLALIPLATVYLAVRVSLDALSALAGAGHISVFNGLEVYVTVLVFGPGVDYCLFLTARYKEELDQGASPREAGGRALAGAGGALTASAATVICGIGMMYFARFGQFQQAGLAIPFSLAAVLLATLTFSPSFLCLAGRWAFWPQRERTERTGATPRLGGWLSVMSDLERLWSKIAQLVLEKPGRAWVVTVMVLVPFATIAVVLYNHVSYDLVGELPANSPSVSATRMLQEHFPAGMVGPMTALLVVPDVDFGSPQGRSVAARITDEIRNRKDQLDVADIRSLTAPLGTRSTIGEAFAKTDLPESVRKKAIERAAVQNYTTSLGHRHRPGTRFDLILTRNPFSAQSARDLGRIENVIRQTLPAEQHPEVQIYFLGTTASIRDLSAVLAQDRNRIEVLVLVSVLAVLLVLLRSIVVPLYLLASVFFSYCASLGVTFVVYWLLDPHGFQGLDWQVPIFLFTILIAVGEDYNIFLVSRVNEEQRRYGLVQGVAEGLVRTGPIISSCGIIMAGTFASLLAASLTGMRQLGFALAFGVLLDTFVVRPILVPAFLVLLHSGRLRSWKWHTPGGPKRQSPAPTTPPRSPTSRPARGA